MPRPARQALVALLVLLAGLLPATLHARVVRVEVLTRTVIAGGAPFGNSGAYERITGRLHYAFDAASPHNARVVDLALAERNAAGEVEAWSEFVLLRPVQPRRRSGVVLLDVVNRGGVTTNVFHLNVRGGSPDSAAAYGDALLLRRGYTLLHLGWQWDVAPGGPRLHFNAPRVRGGANGEPVTGLVRADFTADPSTGAGQATPARGFPLGHALGAGHEPYRVLDAADAANPSAGSGQAVLTVRNAPTGPRTVIPRARWRFARDSTAEGEATGAEARWVVVDGGLEPGRIYELVYRAADPVVVGAGLLAVRDAASWAKHGTPESPRDTAHLADGAGHVIAYGVSQTGRFLRHLLWEGLNRDEQGRKAIDGMFVHAAGAGRGSFNHRFAQPSRDAQPHSTFFYPTDVFPFASATTTDPVTRATGALTARTDTAFMPRVFYVDGGYEYWGRGASLAHTTPDGRRDVGVGPHERRFALAGAQHSGPAGWPLPAGARFGDSASAPAWRGDPLDQRLALRGLLVALTWWVRDDIPPPASAHPTIAAGQLVAPRFVRHPRIPGVRPPAAPTPVYRVDLGPRWAQGIVDVEPPRVGAPYAVLVPQVDSLGNDLGGIRSVELLAPLATYYPWQLREAPPLDRMVSFRGTFVPLPATEADRAARRDPRPSIERLYPSREAYLARVDAATAELVRRRFMLPDDAATARRRMESVWEFVTSLR